MVRPLIPALLAVVSLASSAREVPSTSERSNASDTVSRSKVVQHFAQSHSRAYAWLRELTSTIGSRVTGSAGSNEATKWALKTMGEIGLRQVHTEPWQLSRGWQRGSATARLILPADRPLTVTSYGWCGSTSEPSTEAAVIEVTWNQYEAFQSIASSWAGKIVLLTNVPGRHRDSLADYAHLAEVVSLATKVGAIGIISRNSRPSPPATHTDPVAFARDIPCTLPVLDIAAEDEQILIHHLDAGRPVHIRLSVHNTFSSGPVTTANVVGDIPGTSEADQVVVVGAHLDSWDLGVGAVDDGTGVATVLGAADALIRSGLRPKRTIRFVLFSGEEQGLLGSRAWIAAHRAELPKVTAALIMDWGPGAITGIALSGHDELTNDLTVIAAAMEPFAHIKVRDGYLTYTDAFSFTLAGLPGLATIQDAPTYAAIAHSAADTLAEVDQQVLVHDSAIFGMLALGLADRPAAAQYPWPTEEVSRRLEQDKQLEMLRLLGLWPVHGP